MSQDPTVNSVDNSNSLHIKPKYSQFFEKITSSAQKAKCELAQQIHSKSYKSIEKTIEQEQKKENYSLSTNNISQQESEQNSDNSDESDDEWIEINITKKQKIKPLKNDQNINNDNIHSFNITDSEQKSYLDTIESLNAKNHKLLEQSHQLKQRFNENNQTKSNEADWKCGQCTLIQNINNNQCTLCHSKNPLFETDEKQIIYEQRHREANQQNDHLFALELQQKYERMKDDEKLAVELQRIEEEKAQNQRKEIRNVNSYPAQAPVLRPMYNSNRSLIGNMLLNVLGVVEVPVNRYNMSNNNNIINGFEERKMNNFEDEWNILPVRSLTENDIVLLHKTEEKKSCPICLVDFKIKDETRQLPCFHLFHKQCIDTWFQQQNGQGKHASCPLDRKTIIDNL